MGRYIFWGNLKGSEEEKKTSIAVTDETGMENILHTHAKTP